MLALTPAPGFSAVPTAIAPLRQKFEMLLPHWAAQAPLHWAAQAPLPARCGQHGESYEIRPPSEAIPPIRPRLRGPEKPERPFAQHHPFLERVDLPSIEGKPLAGDSDKNQPTVSPCLYAKPELAP